MTAPNDVAALVERLKAKDAEWQTLCDGWIATANKMDPNSVTPDTDAILRRTLHGEAASALEASEATIATQAATIAALKAEVERLENERAISIVLPRADTLLRTIMSVMPDGTWRIADIRDALRSEEEVPSLKELYNALGYLTRKGFIVSQGYGRYARSASRKENTP